MSSLAKRLKNLKDYRCTMDPKVKDEIVVEYAPLVRFIAQKIASRLPSNIELDDLISCGVIGLMDGGSIGHTLGGQMGAMSSELSHKGWL